MTDRHDAAGSGNHTGVSVTERTAGPRRTRARIGQMGMNLRPIVSATLRSLVLIAIAMLLILDLLPAAAVAAGG